MNIKQLLSTLGIILLLAACEGNPVKTLRKSLNIKNLFSRLKRTTAVHKSDTTNIFDNDNYDPAKIDSADLMATLTTIMEADSKMVQTIGADPTKALLQPIDSVLNDTTIVKRDTFSNDIKKIAPSEVAALKYNLDAIKARWQTKTIDSNAKRQQCKVWAEVSKKDQRLYLWIDGQIVDTFKISTGDKKHETPLFDRRPSGPIFTKYTSKKYPGGSWQGLGNMPYVVFISGGYGIHGTTIGNIKKLGNKASHGCIRVHPDNAKILQELVKAAGINNTWVTVRE
jgi:lipoprotein-anchoring transpeptidase ErfK/SrfK